MGGGIEGGLHKLVGNCSRTKLGITITTKNSPQVVGCPMYSNTVRVGYSLRGKPHKLLIKSSKVNRGRGRGKLIGGVEEDLGGEEGGSFVSRVGDAILPTGRMLAVLD